MRYALLGYADEAGWFSLPKADMEAKVAEFISYAQALKEAGVFLAAYRPEPSSAAKTVRLANGQPVVRDGPHAPSKDQLGGIYVLDLPDLDAALSWAARNPAADFGVVEVRPIGDPPPTA
jgi:hypothetical protein